MKRTMTAAAALLLATACGSADDHGHDHGHGHDHAATEPKPPAAPTDAAPAPAADAPAEAALGAWTVHLSATADALSLTAFDSEGNPVAPSGSVRVELTPAGADAQSLTLEPDGDAWSGAAQPGDGAYMAVITATVDGTEQTARIMAQGAAPPAAPAAGDPVGGHDHAGHDHADH